MHGRPMAQPGATHRPPVHMVTRSRAKQAAPGEGEPPIPEDRMQPDSSKALEIGAGHSDHTPKSGPGAPIVEDSDRLERLKCLK